MTRGAWIAVAVAVGVAAAVALLAFLAARRDRTALAAAFSEEHLSRLRFAALEVETELGDVKRDLEFAARLVEATGSAGERTRELRALLAVVRGYKMIVVSDGSGRPELAVVDPLAPTWWSAAPFERAFAETARRAAAGHALAASPLVAGPHSPWYRVFATPLSARPGDGVVAILVDLRDSFERLRVLAPDPATRLAVFGPDGAPAPMTPSPLAAALAAPQSGQAVAGLRAAMRGGRTGAVFLGAADATALGLADADGVAVFAPIRDVASGEWSVAVLDSTAALRSKARSVTLQLATVGASVALALSILATYLVLTARRTIEVRERLRVAEQVLRAEKLATVGVLAAGIAHEIGTPLGIVRGRAQRIAAKLGPEHPQTAGAQIIVDEIDRIARIIRQLLDYSRPAKASTVSVPLDTVARHVAELLGVEAGARQVSLELQLRAPLPPLAADPDQLQQVLVNLVLNALDACAPGGRVAIRAGATPGGRVAIEVEDDGAGIPEQLHERVFDPFFTTKKRGQGTGLGLTVVAQLVRNHGGELQLESAVGRGTRVRVAWPSAVQDGEDGDGTAERRAHPGGG